jgi:hypothetical protein
MESKLHWGPASRRNLKFLNERLCILKPANPFSFYQWRHQLAVKELFLIKMMYDIFTDLLAVVNPRKMRSFYLNIQFNMTWSSCLGIVRMCLFWQSPVTQRLSQILWLVGIITKSHQEEISWLVVYSLWPHWIILALKMMLSSHCALLKFSPNRERKPSEPRSLSLHASLQKDLQHH